MTDSTVDWLGGGAPSPAALSLEQLTSWVDARLVGSGPAVVGVSALAAIRPQTLTFVSRSRDVRLLVGSEAGAVLVSEPIPELTLPQLIHPAPRAAFFQIVARWYPSVVVVPGVHPSAVVGQTVRVEDVRIDALAVVEEGVVLGPGCWIGAGAVLEAGVVLGPGCWVGPRAVLHRGTRAGERVRIHAGAVVGSRGFGYQWDGRGHQPVPQVGWVALGDDVVIGANCTIDRGTLGPTVIGTGARLDNLVHIAHNVQVGPHCVLAAQTGVAGSATLGAGVLLGGQVAIADHARVADGVQVAGQSGVRGQVRAGEQVAGTPQMPGQAWRRVVTLLPSLPARLKRIEQTLGLNKRHREDGLSHEQPTENDE